MFRNRAQCEQEICSMVHRPFGKLPSANRVRTVTSLHREGSIQIPLSVVIIDETPGLQPSCMRPRPARTASP